MKKFIIATVLAGFVLTSCQKADKEEFFTPEQTVSTAQPASTEVNWQTITLNGTATAKGQTVSNGTIANQSVNDDVLANGLVLVYSNSDAGVELLPASVGAAEWTYSVSNGRINVSVSANKAITSATVFSVVVPSAKVLELENAGYTRSQLVNLSFESATSLFTN